MSHWMFNCEKVSRMVSDSLDRELSIYHRMGIRLHLFMCKLCSQYKKQLLIIRKVIKLREEHAEETAEIITLPPEAKNRITEALRR